MIMQADDEFWKTKTLFEMTPDEWESVCDGCAKCCLTQLQDEDTERLVFTDVACDLLDDETCLCTDYNNRSVRVPSCVTMNKGCLLYTSPSPRDQRGSRMPSSA